MYRVDCVSCGRPFDAEKANECVSCSRCGLAKPINPAALREVVTKYLS